MLKINILCFMLFSCFCFSQTNYINTTAKIKDIKVYFSTASLKQVFSVDLKEGKNVIFVKNFPSNAYYSKTDFKTDKNVNILKFDRFDNNQTENLEKFSDAFQIKKLNDSVEFYRNKLKTVDKEISINSNSISIINKNQTLQNPDSAEILRLIEFNKNQLQTLLNEEFRLKSISADYNKKIILLERKRQNFQSEMGLSKILVLEVQSSKNQMVNFNINFRIEEASWSPYYILESKGINMPLSITYQAKINQNSGIDWNNTPIKLINGRLNLEDKPYDLDRWFLRVEKQISDNSNVFKSKYQENEQSSEIYMLADRSASVKQNMLKTEILLDKSTVVPSNSVTTAEINKFDVTTNYRYFTTPKLENKAYLLASIKDYSKYNLLPGDAEIIIDQTQVGTIHLDTNQLSNEMSISLGSDPNVLVKREMIKKDNLNLGNKTKKEIYEFEITIKNNKNSEINLDVKDQIPLATDQSVKVQLINSDGAVHDESSGFLNWKLTLKPSEIRRIKFGFSVTLPEEFRTLEIK